MVIGTGEFDMRRTLALVLALFAANGAIADNVVQGDLGEALNRVVMQAAYGTFRGCVLVSRDGEIVLARGYASANSQGDPITADSLLELASVSKSFTAVAILRLETQGKLRTDDPISRHLDGVPANKQDVTIHHLLTHTSGIGNSKDHYPVDERDAAVRVMLSAPVESPPGEKFAYSNAGYWLLAAIVERASGQRFEDYMREEVLRPAGMTSSGCQTDPQLDLSRCVDRVADGQRDGSAGLCPYVYTWGYRGSGGVVVSAREMFHWDQALRGDTLLPAAARERMFTPVRSEYGYGWAIRETGLGRVASHTGGVRGFRASLTRLLDRDACVLVISDPSHDPVRLGGRLMDTLFPESAEHTRVTMRRGKLDLGQYGYGPLPSTAEFRVKRSADRGVTMVFTVPGLDDPSLEIEFSRAAAIRVARQLGAHAKAILAAGPTMPEPPMIIVMYGNLYRDRPDPIVAAGGADSLVAEIVRGTPYPEEGGELRVSMVVKDYSNQGWAVVGKFAATRARELEREIVQALGE